MLQTIELSAIPDVNFIITQNGLPEPGVSVEIDAKKIITSATGKSLFVDLPAGSYSYTVSKEGFDTITNELLVANEDMEIYLDINFVSSSFTNASEVQIYPNPSNGALMIELPANSGITKIELFNEIGMLVYTQNNLQRLTNLNLNNLSKGIYLISLSGESRKILLKQIIN
ncbi:MAG: T9SS type A sorting domain-containing protein [Salinivirgaceae bacterium]